MLLQRLFSAPPAVPGGPAGFEPSGPDGARSSAALPPAVSPAGHEAALASRAFLPPSWIPGSLVQLAIDAAALIGPMSREKTAILTDELLTGEA